MSRRRADVRVLCSLLLAGALASCVSASGQLSQAAEADATFARLTAGKTPGPPRLCVPGVDTHDLVIIDGRRIAYRLGTKTTYLVTLSQGCEGLASGYTLVTEHFGGDGPCEGDTARVIDTSSRMALGSCRVNQIVPYSRAG